MGPAPRLLALGLLGQADVLRTAHFHLHGLRSTDFPRVPRLATNVYTFEQIDPTAIERVDAEQDGEVI